MINEYLTHTLPCGLKIAHIPTDSDVAYCGITVSAGSRDEAKDCLGIAHFVEHTIFKGTTRRKAWHILNRMERVGGELNAFTSKEETTIYSIFPGDYYSRAIELIADIVQNSIFPGKELDKEREVVLDEVASYRDMPSEAVYDDFEDLLFAGCGLGHNILGTEDTLHRIGSAECSRFLKNLYVPTNMVLFSYGNINFSTLCRLTERYFGNMNHSLDRIARSSSSEFQTFHNIERIETHQSHTIYGAPTFGMFNNGKYALSLLNNMLAGPGMNSLLNVALREKRGYVYSVDSSATLYSDCGAFAIYFGCDAEHTRKCLDIIGRCISDIADHGIDDKRLSMAKRQYIGQIIVANDNHENVALALGKNMLYFGRMSTITETSEKILSITNDEIRNAAAMLTPDKASTLTLA